MLPSAGGTQNGGTCFASLTQPTAGSATPESTFDLACVSTSNTCQAYRDCVSRNHGPDYCTAHPGDTCDGTVLVHCPPPRGTALDPTAVVPTEDCALAMGECHANNNNAACTTATPCTPTVQTQQPHCDGDHIVSCDANAMRILIDTDCAAQGGTCSPGMGAFPTPQCVPTGAACTVPADVAGNSTSCDANDTLVTCVLDRTQNANADGSHPGHSVSVSCHTDAYQGHCGTLHGVAGCLPNANACAPDSPDRCDGDTLQICVNGQYQGTSCGSIGLAHCTQVDFVTAACTNNAP